MIKKQTLWILICAVLAVVLFCIYLFVLQPLLEKMNAKVDATPELLEGEVLGMNNSILMFDQIERENIRELTVRNAYGEYAVYYNEEKGEFFIRDNDSAPYSKDALSSLVVAAGYPAVTRRVLEKSDDLSEYGLSEEDDRFSYTIETRDGRSFTVWFGDVVPTGAGCYAMFDGREAVYIVDADSCATLFAPVEDMISPILAVPVSQSDYHTVKDFLISRDGEKYVEITTKTVPGKDDEGNDVEDYAGYEMKYPTEYTVSVSVYDVILQQFMNLYGEKVCELGNENEVFSADILEKYGLKTPKYELFYLYGGLQNSIFFSAKQADGTYYAYSLLFNTICTVKAETVYFLEYDLIEYVDKPLLQVNIDDMAEIVIESPKIRADFRINGSGKNIVVTEAISGKTIDVDSFRQFYMAFLTLQMVTYADVTDPFGLEEIGSFTVVTDAGEKTEFAFYPYATRRTLYTVNGVGEFYCLRATVETILSYAEDLVMGRQVVYAAR